MKNWKQTVAVGCLLFVVLAAITYMNVNKYDMGEVVQNILHTGAALLSGWFWKNITAE